MDGFIAKCFGTLITVMSVLILAGSIFAILGGIIPYPFLESELLWFGGLAIFIVYVVIVGALSVAIHTRELAEEQVEPLKQIQFQLKQLNAIQGDASESKRKESVL